MPEIDPTLPERAVSVYGQSDNAYEDFPVLKAFQQYIDAEQSKARKRMLLLGGFFGVLMIVVISVFVILLVNVSSRNQMLNDRLVEYVMRDRDQRTGSAVVVQSPQDTSVIMSLTTKLNELQQKINESQATTALIFSNATAKAEIKKGPSQEELEIARLKALLSSEREKQAIEREKQRQAELEDYRRRHYPELYEQPRTARRAPKARKETTVRKTNVELDDDEQANLLEEVDQILKDGEAVRYFDDDETVVEPPSRSVSSRKKEFSIPVEIRGSRSRWNVPND